MTDPTPPSGLRGAVDLSALVQRPQEQVPQAAAGDGDRIVFETDDAAFGSTLELSRTVPVVVELVGDVERAVHGARRHARTTRAGA